MWYRGLAATRQARQLAQQFITERFWHHHLNGLAATPLISITGHRQGHQALVEPTPAIPAGTLKRRNLGHGAWCQSRPELLSAVRRRRLHWDSRREPRRRWPPPTDRIPRCKSCSGGWWTAIRHRSRGASPYGLDGHAKPSVSDSLNTRLITVRAAAQEEH